jgi:hypothetical protein
MKKAALFLWFVFLLCFPASSAASVPVSLEFKGLGFRLSLVVPDVYYHAGFGVGAHADISLIPLLHVYPSFEYSHAAHGFIDDEYSPSGHSGHYLQYAYLNEFALNGDFRFYPLTGKPAVRPFIGGGFAFIVDDDYYLHVNATDSHDWFHTSEDTPGLAADLLCGLDIPLGKVIGNVEIKGKLGTGYQIFKTTAGLTFPLGGRR